MMQDGGLPVVGLCVFVTLLGAAVSVVMYATHSHETGASPDGEGRGPRTVEVHMRDIKYGPAAITVQVGDTVRWTNGDAALHTVTPTDVVFWGTSGSGDSPAAWLGQGDSWSFTFSQPGTYGYFCIPHASKQGDGTYTGMIGTVTATEADVEAPEDGPSEGPVGIKPFDVPEIGANASIIPAKAEGGHAYVDIMSQEVTARMADGVSYDYWTFDGQVPGRMLRVQEGDTVTVNFTNAPDSTVGHNIDFHAVTGPGGGASALSALPGETRQLTFKALRPGLYVYHCAYQDPPLHVAHGMYGLILVEPREGLPAVDREFYVMEGDFYSPFPGSTKGHHDHSEVKADAEDPSFVVFNGRVGSLRDPERVLQAQVNETVRIYFGVGGPNLVSSFHVIGEIFDHVYAEGDVVSEPAQGIQTTLVPAGGAAIVDFKVEVPGDYLLVDHSLYRVHKGAAGILHVAGPAQPGIFAPSSPGDGGH